MSTWVVILIVIAIVAWLLLSKGGGSKTARGPQRTTGEGARGKNEEGTSLSSVQHTIDANMPWLQERWRIANEQREQIKAGKSDVFPRWYWDAVTERQLEKLSRIGMKGNLRDMSKGQASDVIGIMYEPEAEDAEVLRFFKVKLSHSNQTTARAEVAKLLADPANREAFEKRPATALQKTLLEFCGVKVPRGLTTQNARELLDETREKMSEQAQSELDDFEMLLEEFEDAEFRRDAEVRKPSPSQLLAAVRALQADPTSKDDAFDPYEVAEKLNEMAAAKAKSP